MQFMSKKKITLVFLLFLTITSLFGQTNQVSGVIISATDNEPIIGANVVVHSSKEGVISDANGNFSIQAKSNDVLVFSSVGFISESIALNGRTFIRVALQEDVQLLEQVIVTGYTSQRRADLTGAVSVIDVQI